MRIRSKWLLALGLLFMAVWARAEEVPETFAVQLETTNGVIEVEVYREWAPNAARRFYDLVQEGYFDGTPFHRVIEGIHVEFGYSADADRTEAWAERPVERDPASRTVEQAYLRFLPASHGWVFPNPEEEISSTQIVIELGNGYFANAAAIPPFGRVVGGWDAVTSLDKSHMEKPGKVRKMVRKLAKKGQSALEKGFENVDRITKATILERAVDRPSPEVAERPADLEDGMARLRVYRPEEKDQVFKLVVDGEPKVKLEEKTFYEVDLPAGEHDLAAAVKFKLFATGILDKAMAGKKKLTVHLEPGSMTYVRAASGLDPQKLRLAVVAPSFASKESQDLQPAKPVKSKKD